MNEKLPLKQQLQLFLRALQLIAAFPKPVLLSNAISILAAAPLPFVNLWFSAQILNELMWERETERLVFLVAMLVGLNLLGGLIVGILNRWANVCNSQNHYLMVNLLSKKLLNVDYTDLEDPAFQLEYATLRQHLEGMGLGMHRVFQAYTSILRSLLTVGLSVAFAFTLFTLQVPEGAPLAWLDSRWAIVLVLLVLVCNMVLAPLTYTRGGKIWIKASNVNNKDNRFEMFYHWTMIGLNERAKDIRMYDQKRMVSKTAQANLLDINKWKYFFSYAARHEAVGTFISTVCSGLIYLYVALKAFAGAFGVGGIVQYVGAVNRFTNGVGSLVETIGLLLNNSPFLERMFTYLDTPGKIYQGTIPVEKRDDNDYAIEFHNVSFKYPGSDVFALRNFNLKLQIGQRLAVVGMNGSGKTTMVKLLTRLYDPTEGYISLNGIDIKKYNYLEYLQLFGVVFQDYALMSFTLGENVATGDTYDSIHVTEALEQVGFGKLLETMSLDTYIFKWFTEEGVEVSGGEQQKIVLARALYKNAPFIVLDEPTAALDPIAEYEIYSRFNEMVGEKTAIYISHRLSSCRFCDDIAVFHEGKLIQQGSHDTLIKQPEGMYSQLWNAQAQYYA